MCGGCTQSRLERFLKVLKDYVRNQARSKGSIIAKGYFCAETMFFVNDFSLQLHSNGMQLRASLY